MKHWLVINWPGHWTVHEYPNGREATTARLALEAKLGTNEPVRVCAFGADTLDSVKRTQPNWFIGKEVTL